MAQQNKASDPVSQAMIAIEDALNLGLEGAPASDPAKTPAKEPAAKDAVAKDAARTVAKEPVAKEPVAKDAAKPAAKDAVKPVVNPPKDLAKEPAKAPLVDPPAADASSAKTGKGLRPEEPPRRPAAEAKLTLPERPANDDRAVAGPIVQALQIRKSSPAPVIVAAVGSLLWFGLCAYYGYQRAPHYLSTPEQVLRPETVLFALAALAPVILLFTLAAVARGLSEVRQSAASIGHVAVRLAEPETMATEQFATLAQAIRREVSQHRRTASKKPSRAPTNSTLWCAPNSPRWSAPPASTRGVLRALIAELADQREAVHTKGLAVRDAIAAAHTNAAKELGTLGDTLSRRAQEINANADQAIASVSDRFVKTVGEASAAGVARLDGVGQDVARALTVAAEANAALVLGAVERLDVGFNTRGREFVDEIGRRHEEIGQNFAQSAERVVSAIRSEGLGVVVQLENRRAGDARSRLRRAGRRSPAASPPAAMRWWRRSATTATPSPPGWPIRASA